PVTAFLLCGAPDDPATPRSELANTYATLTELHHFSDTSITFSSQYGIDGPRIVDDRPPFHDVYLLALTHHTPDSRRDATAHLSSYLFHELTTPLGLRLDQVRQRRQTELAPFRSLGTYSVWFPRGLMLQLAARGACARIFEEWQTAGEPTATAELEAAVARIMTDPELTVEGVG